MRYAMTGLTIAAALLAAIIVGHRIIATSPIPAIATASTQVTAGISSQPSYLLHGSVWLNREDGSSDLMRGAKIQLLTHDVIAANLSHCLAIESTEWDLAAKPYRDQLAQHKEEDEREKRMKTGLQIYSDEIIEDQRKISQIEAKRDYAKTLLSGTSGRITTDFAYRTLCDYSATGIPCFLTPELKCEAGIGSQTDADGKYLIKGIPAGSYFLHAVISTKRIHAEWLVPVTFTGSTEMSLDLFNGNAVTIHDYKAP